MKIILASQSPRRKFFLEQMGLEFEAIPSEYEEILDDSRAVDEMAAELGLGKAMDIAQKYPDAIVIGGDCIVSFNGKQLEKPVDAKEAKETLRMLSGKANEVTSSCAVVCLNKNFQRVGTDTTHIELNEMSDQMIDDYVVTGNPMDKAGSYAIQHPMIQAVTASVDGRKDTIIGLPTNLLSEYLAELGINVDPIDESAFDLTGAHQ